MDLGAASSTDIGSDTVHSIEIVQGGSGADTLGGDGAANELYGNEGGDLLQGRAGDDFLEGDDGADALQGGDGADELDGGEGDDRLEGGQGDDNLAGGSGSDTYVFNSGDGVDTVSDFGDPGDTDVLQFGTGIVPGDVTLSRPDPNGADVVLTIGSSGDQITLQGVLDTFGVGVESVQFNGGPTWSAQDLRTMIVAQQITSGNDSVYGTGAAETINGGDGNDSIFGGAGDDTLLGGNGADSLDSGEGADQLTGGAGADSFDLRFPFGADVITDFSSTDGDTIRLSGMTYSGVQAAAHQSGGDVVIDLFFGNSVTITGAQLSSMQSSWFSFT